MALIWVEKNGGAVPGSTGLVQVAGQTARWRGCRASITLVTALFGVMLCRHVVRGEDPGPNTVPPLSLVATKRVGATTVTPRMEKMSPMSDDITFAPLRTQHPQACARRWR
jgi:hypothetical protein